MITTVTLNPCIDRTVGVKNLTPGAYNFADSVRYDVSGKGINVSVVLRNLGISTEALFFDYARGGETVKEFLEKEGIPYRAIPVEGELRMNIKLTDSAQGRMTEINERGNPVDKKAVDALLDALYDLLPQTSLLIVTGSVPPGVPADIYGIMIRMAKEASVDTVLDADGLLLRKGIAAHPWLVKPNRFELETYCEEKVRSLAHAVELAERLLGDGAENVCLSLGEKGAVLINGEETWFSPGIEIPVQGWQGAGDSLVAGLCAARQEGLPAGEQLRWGVAAAHASLLLSGTQLCRLREFQDLLGKIPVEKLDRPEADFRKEERTL